MMIMNDNDRILRYLKFCGKLITSLPLFFLQNSLIKIVLGQNLFKL